MKVTISDVARLAGVSTATVSHTINETRYVSEETREKVFSAIKELGYTPDANARSFRTGRKQLIGFIVPDISNKFFGTMIEAVEEYISTKGYHLLVANTKENAEREEKNIRLMTAGLVDGILIASTMDDFSKLDSLIPEGFPTVLVDRNFEENNRFSSVCVSNFQPIYRAVCRLSAKGDSRIGMIGGLPRLSSTKERVQAYQQAVQDCNLPVDENLISYGTSTSKGAESCLEEILAQKPDALVVAQGLMANDTIMSLFHKGYDFSKDIDLVTFVDYSSNLSTLFADRMDTIIQPVNEVGAAAGELILDRLENPDAPVFAKVLTSKYQSRDNR